MNGVPRVSGKARFAAVASLLVATFFAGCLGGGDPATTDEVQSSDPPASPGSGLIGHDAPVGTSAAPLPDPVATEEPEEEVPVDDVADRDAPVITYESVGMRDITSTAATIFWSVNEAGAAQSWVSYGTESEQPNFVRKSATVSGKGDVEVRLEGLAPDRLYHYAVCARDGNGNVAPCIFPGSFVTAGTGAATPLSVEQAQVQSVSTDRATITWTVANGEAPVRSQVEYFVHPAHPFYSAEVAGTGSLSVEVTGLASDTEYKWRVIATDANSIPVRSEPGTFETAHIDDVTPPTVSDVATTVGDEEIAIRFTLTDDSGMARSRIEYGPSGQIDTFPTLVSGVGNLERTITGLTPNTAYTFRFYVVDAANNERVSDVTDFTTLPYASPSVGHDPVKHVRPYPSGIVFAWTIAGPSVTHSWLEVAKESDWQANPVFTITTGTNEPLPQTADEAGTGLGPGFHQVDISGLEEATLYRYRVIAEAGEHRVVVEDRVAYTSLFLQFDMTENRGPDGFDPPAVTVPRGVPLSIRVTNIDSEIHQWTLAGVFATSGVVAPNETYDLPRAFVVPDSYDTLTYYDEVLRNEDPCCDPTRMFGTMTIAD